LTKIYQSIESQSKKLKEMHECEIFIHEQNLNCENAIVKLDQISCTPPIVLNINNIVIQETLTINDEFINLSKFSNETSEKHDEPKTYFKWKNEHNNELYFLMAIHKHHSFKKIAKMFYTIVHPMLNTQKKHDQLKRL
jgi:hypothetical protein